MARKKKLEMEIINHDAAGIDVGSRSHYVAVGQSLDDVKEFLEWYKKYHNEKYIELF